MEGICRYIYETTKKMVLDHPEDEFYFFFDRAYDEEFIFADNVTPVVVYPQARLPILWKIWFEWTVPYYLKKYNIDVFVSGDTYASISTKVPTLLVSHDIAYHHYPDHLPKKHLNYYKKYFKKFHERADHIVAVSNFTKSDITKAYNLNPEKITVGYNSTPEGYHPLKEETKENVRKQLLKGIRISYM